MAKKQPTVEQFMTKNPKAVRSSLSVVEAENTMIVNGFRHLPVIKGDQIIGIISDRDLKFVQSFKDIDSSQMEIEEVLHSEPYTVSPDTPLEVVVRDMMVNKIGSAIVAKDGKLEGIFTTIDALQALLNILQND
ncbi:MAG: CBS domain-containing protein [Leptospiraceae bacterium]|nr:CBS domain-containing protein [Leptospiraceae bacterium]MCP5496076.1 CBS domain-containing protein [Leptospiraceae bacterium]